MCVLCVYVSERERYREAVREIEIERETERDRERYMKVAQDKGEVSE